MASLDEIFYKEFTQMMYQLKGMNGVTNLEEVPLPPECADRFFIEKKPKVYIGDIREEYYSKLAGTEALLWGTSALKKRKFDHNGEFMKDKDDNYILQDVICPSGNIAIVSDISIGVPTKFKSREGCQYVDMISKELPDGRKIYRFVYIIPKKYCYKLNQTALVLSWNKLRRFYSGVGISLTNGSTLYVYIVPYSPTKTAHNYRVLMTKTSVDYTEEIEMLRDFWIRTGYMFNPEVCQIYDYVKGRENMAILGINGVLEDYERYDLNKSMGTEDDMYAVDFTDN